MDRQPNHHACLQVPRLHLSRSIPKHGRGDTGQYCYSIPFGDMDDPTTSGTTEGFGLMFYNARWYDPTLGRMTQPDSVIPDLGNSQDWDRYPYARNNPLKYNDPSGHWPSGNQIQLSIAIGITLPLSNLNPRNTDKTILLFFALSLVTDEKGGVQLYSTVRDQTYQDGTSPSGSGFRDGPAEKANPSSALTAGVTLAYGTIEGAGFKTTDDYRGYAVDTAGSVTTPLGSFGGDQYVYADPVTGQTDPSKYVGNDINILSFGAPFSGSKVSTYSQPLKSRFELPIVLTAWCKVIGMCGSLPGAGPASDKDMPERPR